MFIWDYEGMVAVPFIVNCRGYENLPFSQIKNLKSSYKVVGEAKPDNVVSIHKRKFLNQFINHVFVLKNLATLNT